MTGTSAELEIGKPADHVWALVGDFGDLSWIPNTKSLQIDGDIRTFQLGDSIVRHRLVSHDDAVRSYTYALVGDSSPGRGEGEHATEATISVVPKGPSACKVTWSSETEERKGSREGLSAFFQGILDHVRNQLELSETTAH